MAMKAPGRNTKDENAKRARALATALLQGKDVHAVNTGPRYKSDGEGLITILSDPELEKMLRDGYQAQFLVELMPKYIKTLKEILDDKDASYSIKLRAGKEIAGLAGFVAPKSPDSPGNSDRGIGDKSTSELRDFISKAQREIADRATQVVDATPEKPEDAPESDAKAAGLLD